MRNNPPTFPGANLPGLQKSIDDSDAHGAAGASNLALSSLQSGAVHIGQLGLGDLSDLSLGDGANLLLVGNTGALGQANCLLDQQRSRGGLGDEGEAAVSVDSDDYGNLVTLHVLGAGIEFLDESSDVNAVLTQSGADRGRSGCLSGVDLKLNNASDFLCQNKHLLNKMW